MFLAAALHSGPRSSQRLLGEGNANERGPEVAGSPGQPGPAVGPRALRMPRWPGPGADCFVLVSQAGLSRGERWSRLPWLIEVMNNGHAELFPPSSLSHKWFLELGLRRVSCGPKNPLI